MKRIVFLLVALLVTSMSMQAQKESKKMKALEGGKVRAGGLKLSGIEMSEALSEDGMSIISVAYKWYAGISKADDKQLAVEMAQREAFATISRIIENAVLDEAERGKLANNGRVQQALKSHWEQISNSLQSGCEPFGEVQLEFDKKTQMYEAIAKVGIRGDKFTQMMNKAADNIPEGLSESERQDFIDANNEIINAAKGQ